MNSTNPSTGEGTPAPLARKPGKNFGLAKLRVNHALRLIVSRHEEGLPADADGREMLAALVRMAFNIKVGRAEKLAEIYRLAPWSSDAERDELERRAHAEQWWPSVDEWGAVFGVTAEERHELRIWQLGATDETPEQRAAAEAQKHRDREAERRKRERAEKPGRPTARSRQDRLLDELPVIKPIAMPDLIQRVQSLPEFKPVKYKASAVHKAADALKARGLLVDEHRQTEGGRKVTRWVRRARESDRRAAAADRPAVAPSPPTEAPSQFLAHIRAQLEVFDRDNLSGIGLWFERTRVGLTDEQSREVRKMMNDRASEIMGRPVFVGKLPSR